MKKNILQNFCFQELQDGTGVDYACSSWKLLPVKVGLSPFLDQEDGYLKNVHLLADGQTVTKYSAI